MAIPLKKITSLNLPAIGLFIIAAGLVAFGIQHFLYVDFITGRPPLWVTVASTKIICAYLSGGILIATGILVFLKKNARVFLILCAIMLCGIIFLHLAVLIDIHFAWGGELTNGGKVLSLFSGLLAAAGSLPAEHNLLARKFSWLINQKHTYILMGRIGMGLFLIISGYEHFLFLEFVKTLVPSWIPGSAFWSIFSGVALMAGGIGLMIPKTAPLAGMMVGFMIFTWFLILHLPRGIADFSNQNEWIAVVEAFIFTGIAFILTTEKS